MPTGTYLDDLPAEFRPAEQPAQARTQTGTYLDDLPDQVFHGPREIDVSGEDPITYLGRRAVPFGSTIYNFSEASRHQEAYSRWQRGTETEADRRLIAAHAGQERHDAGRGVGGQALSALAHAPAIIGEFAAGGALLGNTGLAAEGAGLGARVGSAAIRGAAITPFVPSSYLPHLAENNRAAGREVTDPRGLPAAMALGAINNTVIGSMQNMSPFFHGSGVGNFIARNVTRAGAGVVEQAIADTVTGLTGLSSDHGTVGDWLAGRGGDALKRATVQFITFAAFSVMHEVQTPHEVKGKLQEVLHEADASHSSSAETAQRIESEYGQMYREYAEHLQSEGLRGLRRPGAVDTETPVPQIKPAGMPEALRNDIRETFRALGLKKADVTAALAKLEASKKPITSVEEALRAYYERPESIPSRPTEPAGGQAEEAPPSAPAVTPGPSEQPVAPKPTEAAPESPREVASFKTAKGSTYQVHEDGTTARNKASRSDIGHEGDSGVKERSARTVYVDADKVGGLSSAGLSGPVKSRVILKDGKASLLTWNEKEGRWGRSPSGTDIAYSETPKVGLAPLELWTSRTDVAGHEAYSEMHAGNRITEIGSKTPKPPAEAPPQAQVSTSAPATPFKPNVKVADRNAKIKEMLDQGIGYAQIGKELGISKARVGQIAQKQGWAQAKIEAAQAQARETAPPRIAGERAAGEGLHEMQRSIPSDAVDHLQDLVVEAIEHHSEGKLDLKAFEAKLNKIKGLDEPTKKETLNHMRTYAREASEQADAIRELSGGSADVEATIRSNVSEHLRQSGADAEIANEIARTGRPAQGNAKTEAAPASGSEAPSHGLGFDPVELLAEMRNSGMASPHEVDALGRIHSGRGTEADMETLQRFAIRLRENIERVTKEDLKHVESIPGPELTEAEIRRAETEAQAEALAEVAAREEATEHPEATEGPPGAEPAPSAASVTTGPNEPLPPATTREVGGTFGGGTTELGSGAANKSPLALAHEYVGAQRLEESLASLDKQASQSFQNVWEAARRADPQATFQLAQEIVSSNGKKGITTEQEAALLHRMIAVRNELAQREADVNDGKLRDASDRTLRQWNSRGQELREQREIFDKASVLAGSEAGRLLAFRRQLVKFDYSLDSLIRRAEAANTKEPLTPEHRKALQEASERIKTLEEQLQRSQDELAKKPNAVAADFAEVDKTKIKINQVRDEAEQIINSRAWKAKPTAERAMDWLRKLRVAELICGFTTNLRIGASSVVRTFEPAVDNVIGTGLRMLPGIREVAERAPLHGQAIDPAIEVSALKYAKDNVLQTMKDYVVKGKSELDLLHGASDQGSAPRTLLDKIGEVHAAEKALACLAAYQRTTLYLEKAASARGEPMSPRLHEEIGQQAYQEYQRAKFQADHALTDFLNSTINKAKKHENAAVRTLGHIADQLVPIRKIPTNIVLENFERLMGVPIGVAKIGLAKAKGVQLTAEQADTVMRQLKKGSLGVAALALGYYLGADKLGGLYSGRRRDNELQPGEVDTGIGKVPNWATAHQPLFSMLHLGAAIRREEDKIENHRRVGLGTATVRSMGAMLEEVPYLREQKDVGHILHGDLGPLARSYAVPSLLHEIARRTDTREGNPLGTVIHRTPHGLLENIEMGVPGLRQRVPVSRR